jgi:chromate reductase
VTGATPPFRILAIPGSLRRESFNRAMLMTAIDHAPDGVAIELVDDLGSLPHFDEDVETDATPQVVLDFRRRIESADALLIATPEYNSSIPGVIKNAIDWASRPPGRSEIVGKPTAVMSASTGSFGGVWAQAELRKALKAAGARVHEEGVSLAKARDNVDNGRVVDEQTIDEIVALVGDLVTLAHTPIDDW